MVYSTSKAWFLLRPDHYLSSTHLESKRVPSSRLPLKWNRMKSVLLAERVQFCDVFIICVFTWSAMLKMSSRTRSNTRVESGGMVSPERKKEIETNRNIERETESVRQSERKRKEIKKGGNVCECVTCSLTAVSQVWWDSDLPALVHTHSHNAFFHSGNLTSITDLYKECCGSVITMVYTHRNMIMNQRTSSGTQKHYWNKLHVKKKTWHVTLEFLHYPMSFFNRNIFWESTETFQGTQKLFVSWPRNFSGTWQHF